MAANTLPEEPAPPKSLFDKVMVSTPVLLTVVATFLVGQSTSEMTRAQYYRSLASQNQSKAGDQWALFQAKRARGQTQEMAAVVLAAQSKTLFTRNAFVDATQETLNYFKSREASCRASAKTGQAQIKELQLMKQLPASQLEEAEKAFWRDHAKLADGFKKLVPAAQRTSDQAKSLLASAASANLALDALLTPASTKKTPRSKGAADAKNPTEPEVDPEGTEQLTLVIEDIKQKRPEREIAKKALKLDDEALEKAIAASERRADEVNKRGKKIDSVLEEFDDLLDQQTQLARECQGLEEPGRIHDLTRQLHNNYKAARLAYNARRYEDDARSNQESAYLYEVKVYLNSARSDKHLFRSKMFMFAMLAAQAGVAISTLALAVKRRSVFWTLATLAGLIAIALGVYVFLDLPMPTF